MIIQLIEPATEFAQTLYFGTRTRQATVTDVDFLSDTRIVVAHRYACKLYVIDIGAGTHTIVSTKRLMYNGRPHQTEMVKVVGNDVYVISYSPMLFIFEHNCTDGTLRKKAEIVLNHTGTPYHGIEVHGGSLYMTPSNKAAGDDRIVKYNIADGTIEYGVSLGIRVKDIGFFGGDACGYVIIVGNYKSGRAMTEVGSVFDATVRVFREGMYEEVDRMEIPLCHFDALAVRGDTFYATCSDGAGGWILSGKVGADGKLVGVVREAVADFPHGINIRGAMRAYTSYTTSSVYLEAAAAAAAAAADI